ncbi:MAG TPA: YkgJ family cysteine cluster protein [Candidatus Acidoferrum sp.]|nr:YkgJ family cysteine cluster protein [Candidatus Acidoferrum sp.]
MTPDRDLIQIVDAAMAEAVRIGGPWIACRPGCTQCCIDPFPITMLDAARLRSGLDQLESVEPDRAAAVRRRAQEYLARLAGYPGDPRTGVLAEGAEAGEQFAALAEGEACPALDPVAGTCDLYASRPLTCRVFGPAVRMRGDALGVCELCFEGASDEQIAECAVDVDPDNLEAELLAGDRRQTIVAFALRDR